MIFNNKAVIQIISLVGKSLLFFIVTGIGVHTFTMFLDYFLVPEPFHLNLHTDFIGSVFSVPMIPMIFVYGSSFLTIYFLSIRTKKALDLVQQKEIQREKVELVFQSLQHITGLLAKHITVYNSEVLGWIEFKKKRGHIVSEKVEKPTQNIEYNDSKIFLLIS